MQGGAIDRSLRSSEASELMQGKRGRAQEEERGRLPGPPPSCSMEGFQTISINDLPGLPRTAGVVRMEEWIPMTGKCRSDFGPREQRSAEIWKHVIKGREMGLGNVEMRFKAIGFQCCGC